MKVFLQEHYVMSGSIIFSGFFMCYALTKSTIVVYDMWMNYEDFTRTRRTNALSQVNGIASEYVRRLDDDPSHHCYREKDSARSSVSHATNPTSTDMNLVSVCVFTLTFCYYIVILT